MKIALLDIWKPGDKKDFNSGYGTTFTPGSSFLARILTRLRSSNEYLPLLNYGYNSAVLKQNGHDVELVENTLPVGFDLVILHASLIRHNEEMAMLEGIRKSQTPICIIGPLGSEWPHLFDELADTIIIGDAETVLAEFHNIDDLPKGRVKATPVENLDELPFPDWSIYDYRKFTQYPLLKSTPIVMIQGSRSCPYKCNYCPYITPTKNYKTRTPDNVIAEIKHMKKTYGAKSILFRDPVFGIKKKWALELCKKMVEEKVDMPWACETRTDHLDEEMIDIMYDAGLRAMKVGIESSDAEILKNLKRKPPEFEHQDRMVRYAEKKGIAIAAFYIVGLLDDTVDTMELTLQDAIRLNPSFANFNLCTPLPGTEFYDQVKDRIYDFNLNNYDNYHSVFTANGATPEQISYYQDRSMVRFYFRLGFFFKAVNHMLFRKN